MTRPKHIDLKKADDACPHCGGNLFMWQRKSSGTTGWRCGKCKCRWSPMSILIHWGVNCPILVRT